jgi:hypothetical protein
MVDKETAATLAASEALGLARQARLGHSMRVYSGYDAARDSQLLGTGFLACQHPLVCRMLLHQASSSWAALNRWTHSTPNWQQ